MASSGQRVREGGIIRPGEARKLIANFEKVQAESTKVNVIKPRESVVAKALAKPTATATAEAGSLQPEPEPEPPKPSWKVLIVHAHHEDKSYNSALLREAVRALTDEGHAVTVSDLYAMGFNPLTTRKDVVDYEDNAEVFQYSFATAKAYADGKLSDDIKAEQAKLDEADLTILQFPVQWYGFPAILKGWVDRVYTMGYAFDNERKFDTGMFKGKKLMLSFTTGGPAVMYNEKGLNGELSSFLWPLQLVFRLFGYDILAPNVVHSPGHMSAEERAGALEAWGNRLQGVFEESPLYFLPSDTFEGVVLKEEAEKELRQQKLAPDPGHPLGLPLNPTCMTKPREEQPEKAKI